MRVAAEASKISSCYESDRVSAVVNPYAPDVGTTSAIAARIATASERLSETEPPHLRRLIGPSGVVVLPSVVYLSERAASQNLTENPNPDCAFDLRAEPAPCSARRASRFPGRSDYEDRSGIHPPPGSDLLDRELVRPRTHEDGDGSKRNPTARFRAEAGAGQGGKV